MNVSRTDVGKFYLPDVALTTVVIMLLTVVVGAMGNICLCYIVLSTKSLRTYMNAYVVNIAVADIVCCFILVPMRISAYIGNRTNASDIHLLCKGDMFFRTLTDTARLLLLELVSYERYQAISNPFNRDKKIPKRRTVISSAISWIVACVLGVISVIFFEDSAMLRICYLHDQSARWGDFELYVILPTATVSLSLIMLFYALIFKILIKHSSTMSRYFSGKRNKIKPASGEGLVNVPGGSVGVDAQATNSPYVLSVKVLVKQERRADKERVNSESQSRVGNDGTSKSRANQEASSNATSVDAENKGLDTIAGSIKTEQTRTVEVVEMDGTVHAEHLANSNSVYGAICVRDNKNRVQGRRKVELRAAKKISLMIGTFLCLWLPFPVAVLTSRSATNFDELNTVWMSLIAFLSSFSTVTVAINPIIYGLGNKQIKTAAARMLKNLRCKTFARQNT